MVLQVVVANGACTDCALRPPRTPVLHPLCHGRGSATGRRSIRVTGCTRLPGWDPSSVAVVTGRTLAGGAGSGSGRGGAHTPGGARPAGAARAARLAEPGNATPGRHTSVDCGAEQRPRRSGSGREPQGSRHEPRPLPSRTQPPRTPVARAPRAPRRAAARAANPAYSLPHVDRARIRGGRRADGPRDRPGPGLGGPKGGPLRAGSRPGGSRPRPDRRQPRARRRQGPDRRERSHRDRGARRSHGGDRGRRGGRPRGRGSLRGRGGQAQAVGGARRPGPRTRHPREQHELDLDRSPRAGARPGSTKPLLRDAFLQPGAGHAARGADPWRRDRQGDDRCGSRAGVRPGEAGDRVGRSAGLHRQPDPDAAPGRGDACARGGRSGRRRTSTRAPGSASTTRWARSRWPTSSASTSCSG